MMIKPEYLLQIKKHINRPQWWTISVFVMTILICGVFIGLHFQETQTHRRTIQHLDHFRHAQLDLNHGLILLLLAQSNNPDIPIDHNQAHVLLDQALLTFEQQASQLQLSENLLTEFIHELNNFHELLDITDLSALDTESWIRLWIAFDQLERLVEALDARTLVYLQGQTNALTQVFGLTIIIAILLLSGIAFGVYRAERARSRSELKLQQSEARYRAVVGDQTELICRYTPDFRLTFANPAICNHLNKSLKDLVGFNLLSLMPEKDHDMIKKHVYSLDISNPVTTFEYASSRSTNGIQWQQWNVQAVFDDQQNVIEYQGVGRDITAIKQAQEALRESESRLRVLIESQTHFAVQLSPDGYYLYCNPAYQKLMQRNDLIGVYVLDSVCEYHHERTIQAIQMCLAEPGKIFEVEVDKYDGNGDIRTTLWEVVGLADTNGEIHEIQCMGIDITERKANERAILQSAQRLNILHQLDQAILMTVPLEQLAHDALKGVLDLVSVNRVALFTLDLQQNISKLIGYKTCLKEPTPTLPQTIEIKENSVIRPDLIEALTNRRSHKFIATDDYHPIMIQTGDTICAISLKHQSQLVGVLYLNMPLNYQLDDDLLQMAIEIADQIAIGIQNLNQQEAIHRHTEELESKVQERTAELQAEKIRTDTVSQRLQLAVEAGNIGVWEYDLSENRFIVDDVTLQQYGLTHSGFDGSPQSVEKAFMQSIYSEDVAYVYKRLERAIQDIEPYDVQFRVNTPEGGIRHIKANAIMLRDNAGNPIRLIGASIDITKMKEAEKAILSALEQEKELSELKSRFVSMASHEFRTPLAIISVTTETLLAYRDRLDPESFSKRLNKILDQVEHMKQIMEDFLQIARIQSGRLESNREESDLNLLCKEIIEEFSSRPEYHHRITFNGNTSSIMFSFDMRLMRYVIGNLISNALKYSPHDTPVSVNLKTEPDNVLLTVKDQGIGIPDSDLKHLFDPFHRGENVGTIQGTGLGLSIARDAVKLHGGEISIETEVGVGTSIMVTFPR